MASPKKANTLADFKSQFDPNTVVPNKIKSALAAMLKEGPEHWVYETDMIKLAGISTVQISQFREQFNAHVVSVKSPSNRMERKIWFADAKVAAKVRNG